jgi:DNA-directed RNA polymerase specialized sigma subunit
MKISLNIGRGEGSRDPTKNGGIPERDIIACRDGDWEARARVVQAFTPLLLSLAKEKTQDPESVEQLVEAGRTGLLAAVRKYKPTGDADRFQLFALDLIEKSMAAAARPRGFFSRLFRKK